MACTEYTIVPQDCPCKLVLQRSNGPSGTPKLVPLDLHHATVMYTTCGEGFYIKTPNGNAVIDAKSFELSFQELQDLVYACCGGTVGRSIEEPMYVDMSGCMIQCGEEPTDKGVLPVAIVCDRSNDTTLACTEDTRQLVFVDTSVVPATATLFDGTPYTGNIIPCEQDYKWSEREYCSDEGVYVRIVCWNITDPTNSQTVWVTPEGNVSQEVPTNAQPCDQVCDPYSTSYFMTQEGIQPNNKPYNLISIHNPECTNLNMTISSGTHIIPKKADCYELQFDCLLDPQIEISKTDPDDQCNIENILVTILRKS